MPFPDGWPPRSASDRRSVRVRLSGTCTGGFQDTAFLFSDVDGANTFTPTPVVPPGAEKLQVHHGSPPGGGRLVAADTTDPRYSGSQTPPKPMLFVQMLKIRAPGSAIEFSFDGVNVHGHLVASEIAVYRNRFEAGIALRFVGTPASGSIAAIAGSGHVDGETFVLDDGVNPAVTFEFDSDASVAETDTLRRVVFDGTETDVVMHDLIIAAVNTAPVLDVTASDGGGATVTLVNDRNGTVGNVAITETVTAAGFVVTGMSGGVGADTTFEVEGW